MATPEEQQREQLELLRHILRARDAPTPSIEEDPPLIQDRFELFRLPPELRLLAYEFAVVDKKPKTCIGHHEKSHLSPRQPALTRTCREIRAETLKLFYGSNVFEFQDANVTIDCLYRDVRSGISMEKNARSLDQNSVPFRNVFDWLKRIGRHNVCKIKTLRISLSSRDMRDPDTRAIKLSRMVTARAEIQDVLRHYSRHAGFALPAEITLARKVWHFREDEQSG